jgi:hypothetical protein
MSSVPFGKGAPSGGLPAFFSKGAACPLARNPEATMNANKPRFVD